MAIAAETSGTANATECALGINQAQIASAQSVTLPNSKTPVVPWVVGVNGAATYSVQNIMGNFAGGTYYPYPSNGGVPVQEAPAGGFSGGLAQYWPDPNLLNQHNTIWNQTNYLYRI